MLLKIGIIPLTLPFVPAITRVPAMNPMSVLLPLLLWNEFTPGLVVNPPPPSALPNLL